MSNVIPLIKKDGVNPTGWKHVELNFLYENLVDGDSICIGEGGEGGWEGVSATVLLKNPDREVLCVDLKKPEDGTFLDRNIKSGKVKFIQSDFNLLETEQKFDNVVCINVLEHFGFFDDGRVFVLGYDIPAFSKMLDLCRGTVIITIPFNYKIFDDDNIAKDGRFYTEKRLDIFKLIALEKRFFLLETTFIDVNKNNDFAKIDNQTLSEMMKNPLEADKHLFIKALVFKK